MSRKLTLNEIEAGIADRLLSGGMAYYLAVLVCGGLVLAATAAGVYSMVVGHEHTYNVTREVPWGILIATYVFFVVTSTGLCLVSSIGHVFGVESYMPIAKRSVFLSIATILAGFFVIAFEIKIPWRMAVYNVISPNLTSNIWWMGTLYGIYLVLMLFEFLFLNLNKHKPAVACGFGGAIAGIAAHSNLGAVFGLLMGREFWHGPYMSIYFIASAAMTGTAVIILFHWLGYKVNGEKLELDTPMVKSLDQVRKLGILLICVIIFFTIWKMVAGVAGMPGGKYEAIMALVKGPYAFNFWFFEAGCALLIPLAVWVLSKGKNLTLMFATSAMMIIGIFIMRYDLVIVGEVIPVYHELGVNEFQHILPYKPSFYEIIITLGGFCLAGFLFLLGEKLFAGHKVEAHH
ncbi:MAG: polysulfide reductase [Desulfuromonas sp.]|uniref:NrfD/PsrC family molybdoenzyme membrane anchor subunit n=1 Tax=Desulfuromonas sp. TaxID=892 RepID=UPI000CA9F2C1|nr:NrfD/PsrC family molybdoenzyme membrane anchor subunit [Desulfuromonas sp.]PLX84371.1 MAG: polysulfide reductase [Desulfuromonas sp.]